MSKISDYGGDFIPCGNVVTSKNGKNFVGKFRGKPLWIIFENKFYEENINKEFPNKHYQSKHTVPKYIIHKSMKQSGLMFPRATKSGKMFLFCLTKSKGKQRNYYIWDVDKKHNIKENAMISFDIKQDAY